MKKPPDWLIPWAKLGRSPEKIYPNDAHPVACHLLDVAHVTDVLWSRCLSESVRLRWATALGLSVKDAGRWIAFWAGCHDIGKACPGFQYLETGHGGNAKTYLEAVGLCVGNPPKVRHDHVSANVLPELWKDATAWPAFDPKFAKELAAVIGGHHGIIPTTSEYGSISNSQLGDRQWKEIRRKILVRLAEALDLANCPVPRRPTGANRGFFLVLAGLIAVADWIGSNQEFFEARGFPDDWEQYREYSQEQAERAVKSLGWTGWDAERTEASDFKNLFNFGTARPLQDCVERLVNNLTAPALLLVEAPMGEGKTEAALYAADRHTHGRGGRGMYVALPTTATSNGMFERVQEFLKKRYPHERSNLQLLHGRTFLSDRFEKLRLAAIAEDQPEELGRVVAEEWFTKDKKQGLLAPFAVGTIDQALLSVLQTKFGFVRLFGLAGKTVILDEVHAYDAYTSTILGRMLAWLAAIGSPVVLLSATLPRVTRHRLIAEYLHSDPEARIAISVQDDAKRYPRVTIAVPETNMVSVEEFDADPQRAIEIRLQLIERDSLASRLAEAVKDGGTAAVICNTVNTAQNVFREMLDAFSGKDIGVDLFHARFPLGDRQRIEDHVLHTYGKKNTDQVRPARVLVATQVVEQSLDLDFDLMVTEFAPIDLILQRAGRLHRHDRLRPQRLERPELWLLTPHGETNGVPDFGAFEDTVYSRFILLLSFKALRNRDHIALPGDIERLVESVYVPEASEPGNTVWEAALGESCSKYELNKRQSHANAQGALIPLPSTGNLLRRKNRDLPEDEDDPRRCDSRVAKTREGRPSIAVALLYRIGDALSLTQDGSKPIDLSAASERSLVREIVKRSVSLSNPAWVCHFAAQEGPSGWRRCGPLRFHRVAELDAAGAYRGGPGLLRYDETIGVEFRRGDE